MTDSRIKAFVVCFLWALLFASLGDLAEYYLDWDADKVRLYLMGAAFYWVLEDLYSEREDR